MSYYDDDDYQNLKKKNEEKLEAERQRKELIEYINGKKTLDEAIELIKQRSRKYAKRQYTWFKHQMDVTWFNVNYEDFNKTISEIVSYIEKNV